MTVKRREFLRTAGVSAAAFGLWSFRTSAGLLPAKMVLGHISDARLSQKDDPEKSGRLRPGLLLGHANSITTDIVEQFEKSAPGAIVFTGKTSKGMEPDQTSRYLDKLAEKAGARTGRPDDEVNGFRLVHVADNNTALLARELAADSNSPIVLCSDLPLLDEDGEQERGTSRIIELLRKNPRVVLVLASGDGMNRADFIPGTSCLHLATCSPVLFPCGGRVVEVETTSSGEVSVKSRFVQTRLLPLVEKSFHQAKPKGLMSNLGDRKDRSFTADSSSRKIAPQIHAMSPNLAPFWKDASRVNLAVMSDTHICLDKYVDEKHAKDNELIGHFNEKGSKEIFSDIIEQVGEGRHRTEFYDAIFAKDPDSEHNYVERDIDGLLLTGDLTEHGRKEEAEIFKAGLDSLPEKLRKKTMLTMGNHDRYPKDFSPRGPKSDNSLVTDFYKDYVHGDDTTYAVELSEWASLIVVDSTTPSTTPLGIIQHRIDWIEDQIAARPDKAVIVACHHPLYHLTTVPPLMQAYLRSRSHFTPKHASVRTQMHDMLARYPNVKLVVTGHYHGTVVDRFEKASKGPLPDDAYTTHIQVPCTIEYPNAYRLITLSREEGGVSIDYRSAYTRRHELRTISSRSTLFKLFGRKARPGRKYRESIERLAREENFFGDLARLDGYDLTDMNVRGYKDGTAFLGKGRGGKYNVMDRIVVSI